MDTDAWMVGRLFNVTAGAPVSDTEVLVIYRRDTINPAIGSTGTTFAVIEVTAPTVIRSEVTVQIRLGRIRNAYAWSDLNARTKVGYLKTGD